MALQSSSIDQRSSCFTLEFVASHKLYRGRGGAVVRALAFYTDALSSIPGKGKNQTIGRSPVDPAVNEYLVL